MSKFLFSNGAKTTVNGSLTQGGTVLVLAFNTGNFFPSPTEGNFFYGTLYEKDLAGIETRIEVVKVINRVADTLTLERDVETLTGQVGGFFYPSGAGATVYFELRVTAGVMQGLVQTADQILALESKSDTDHTHTELYEPKNANIQAHLVNTTNPHGVTRAQVGLGNVNNTSDADKPVSTAQAEAIAAAKSQAISAIPTSLPASDVSAWAKEATKPSYTPAEIGAQPELVSGETLKTVGGVSLLGKGDVPLSAANAVTLTGNLSPYATQTTSLTITNYDSATTYGATATGGTVSLSGETITYVAGATAGVFAITITAGTATRSVPITVQAAAVAAPSITSPANGATNIGQTPTITTGAFSVIVATDTHLNTDWEVRTETGGAGTLIALSLADSINKLSWAVPGNLLAVATTYYARARHRGATLGAGAWSESSFTTAATFRGNIGAQGGQGFGVGQYPGTLPSGFSALTGTDDKTSVNYGNYQYSDGSIMVFVPKFFYRIGNAASPRYATYGANAVDVVGIESYANESAANAEGYAMHRAFYDGGAEKSGFFIDKYLASKTGTTSCKSIAYADPISLTVSEEYNPSSTQTGCTGLLPDAVVLARSRGALFNVESIFIRSALAMLTLAHAQAATGTANCAWYDAAGTKNFPKGCNNGALADHLDSSVTYAVSMISPKPKTRATANFAKTTHNGQECGVADLNGSLYQVLIGLTSPGTSATDASAVSNGNCYVLKRSVALASLTGGYGGAKDAWGTAANLAANYDAVTGLMPWGATTGSTNFGNGANNVFSGATSGVSYTRTACGIQDTTSGTSAAGTNQFGNDQCYQYNVVNLLPYASGYWYDAASAGVFYRNWSNSRCTDSRYCGFRCAAYGQ